LGLDFTQREMEEKEELIKLFETSYGKIGNSVLVAIMRFGRNGN